MQREEKLTKSQWDLLLKTAKANEAHDEPPRIKGSMYATAAVLMRKGFLEAGGRRCTEKGWFYVRDNIAKRPGVMAPSIRFH